MDHEKVLGEHKFPTYEELKTGLIRLIDEGKISREDAARLLPELGESEDERIRKAVVSLVYEMKGTYQSFAKVELDKMVAWLEKQKEQKPSYEDVYSLEKVLEDELDKRFDIHPQAPSCIHALALSIAAKMSLGQKPAEWSEEDDKIMQTMIKEGDLKPSEIAWLKSLRPQPQGTYKLIVHNIYEMLKDKDFFDITPSHRVSLLNDICVRCKNADEQAEILDVPSWRPSEEQMNYLCAAVDAAIRKHNESVGGYEPARVLKSLYEDLKKL